MTEFFTNDPAMNPWRHSHLQGWGAVRLKWLVDLINLKTTDIELPYVGLEQVEPWTGRLQDAARAADVEPVADGQSNRFSPGDVLFGKLRPYLAKVHHAGISGRCSSELLVLRPRRVLAAYLKYLLLAEPLIRLVDSSTFGAKMPRADWEFIGRVVMPAPPLPVQGAIADLLDRKTTAIDALIAKKERLLVLAEEHRANLITRAVTTGLVGDVALRDSGAPSIGRIPAHWGITRLKFVCSRIVDGVHSTPEYTASGVPFVTVKNLTSGPGISFEDLNYIRPEDHQEFCRRARPERGDVLVTKDGTLGVCRVVETDRAFSIFVSVALVKPSRNLVDSYFLRYGLESSFVNQQLESRRLGSALKHIHLEDLSDLYFPLPPVDEQRRIAEHVREVAQNEEWKASRIVASIRSLREYRQALITAGVTGQLDVSEEAA